MCSAILRNTSLGKSSNPGLEGEVVMGYEKMLLENSIIWLGDKATRRNRLELNE